MIFSTCEHPMGVRGLLMISRTCEHPVADSVEVPRTHTHAGQERQYDLGTTGQGEFAHWNRAYHYKTRQRRVLG
jgi:hypothetical protein